MSQCYDLPVGPEIDIARRALATLRQSGAGCGPIAEALGVLLPEETHVSISHDEAQELHETIGTAIETGDPGRLPRAREIAAVIVSDTAEAGA